MPNLVMEFEQKLSDATVAAFVLRHSDGTSRIETRVNWLTRSQVEQAFARLAHSAQRFANLEARWFTWRLEYLRVYFTARADGASLAVFVEASASATHEAVVKLLEEFKGA